jgi:hypothetical protein
MSLTKWNHFVEKNMRYLKGLDALSDPIGSCKGDMGMSMAGAGEANGNGRANVAKSQFRAGRVEAGLWLAGLSLAWLCLALPSPPMAQTAPPTPSPPGAQAYFHYPLDGLSVPQRFTVRIGLHEMGVAPAGVNKPLTGHHHLLIDTDPGPNDQPIPSDYNHIHLGNGQTEVVVTLPRGTHTLQLVLGDYNHIPHKPPVMSKKIVIHVR